MCVCVCARALTGVCWESVRGWAGGAGLEVTVGRAGRDDKIGGGRWSER